MMSSAAFAINYNLFCYPMGYFEEHTAEELKITEEERQEFIKIQKEVQRRRQSKNKTDTV